MEFVELFSAKCEIACRMRIKDIGWKTWFCGSSAILEFPWLMAYLQAT